jgi:hypothetical protein
MERNYEIKSEEAYMTNLKTKTTEIGDTKILLGCEFAAILSTFPSCCVAVALLHCASHQSAIKSS